MKKKKPTLTQSEDDETLPVFGKGPSTSTSRLPNAPAIDASSVPPTITSNLIEGEFPSMPPPFTPSIKATLEKPGVDEGTDLVPLPEGLSVTVLKSRLEGKKIKYAFQT